MDELDGPAAQRLQSREWLAERIGWGVVGLLLTAGMLGLLGPGILSHANQSSASGVLGVQYDQVVRSDAPTELTLTIEKVPTEGPVVLQLSRYFLKESKRDAVTPQPLSQSQTESDVVWNFSSPTKGQRFQVTIRYQYDAPGYYASYATVAGDQVRFTQFVLP
jgi:hypothetical protein